MRIASMSPAPRPQHEEAPPVEDFSTTSAPPIPHTQIFAAHEKPASVKPPVILQQHMPKPDPQPALAQPAAERPPLARTKPARESLRQEEKAARGERNDATKEPLRPATQGLQPNSSQEPDSLPLPAARKPVARRPDLNVTERETPAPSPQSRRVETAKETATTAQQRTTEKAQPVPIRPEGIQAVANPSPTRTIPQTPVIARTEPLEDSSPSVHVVIGRVIVQAIAPPPVLAPPAPRPQTPRLSLEEYLKQREGRA